MEERNGFVKNKSGSGTGGKIDPATDFPIHKAVFEGNIRVLSALLRQGQDLSKKDVHGNTALHISLMLGQKECTQLLLAHNCPVKAKNTKGWSCLAEAISYGDKPTIISVLRKSKQQLREQMSSRRPHLIKALEKIDDFYMELKWDFQSWVPLVSRILPSDLVKIHKKGSSIRVDTTLMDFNDMRWERGDLSFLFNAHYPPNHTITLGNNNNHPPLVLLDNKQKVYQVMKNSDADLEFEDEVDILMSSDIIVAQLSTKEVNFQRAQSGWFFIREDRREKVGQFNADIYSVSGISLDTKKRREHLTQEDLAKNKEILVESFTKPSADLAREDEEYQPKESLEPPPKCTITWEEYIKSKPDQEPHLGRPLKCKSSSKAFKATMAMSDEFPMTVEMLLNILEVVTPFKHLKKLREFVNIKLPPGFPVKIEIPILPTITAKVTFQSFSLSDNLADEYFTIPTDYTEKANRFPYEL